MIFSGTFTAGDLDISWTDGRTHIVREGAEKKFVGKVQQVTYSGALAAQNGSVMANGQPSFAAYQRGPDGTYRAYAVTVPTVTATGIARIVTFFNPDLFGSFGLPTAIPGDPAGL